ncbi:ABC transporter ATP-binding protein [Ruminiclostridium herbifermentans]|uniref:ABC transporter ATP-binding protein n=1 Tax=Ruminiclostridium herbifermentans TaxID=2488810 RepID=A0A4U7JF57_9FIRM|nr:ABC transporter ATP-binding protein [Ruminiclostridium herbifermentans]QNU67324.1 ABC transporter ATP-binding protein [Ruminiclostridium herbifermentans]
MILISNESRVIIKRLLKLLKPYIKKISVVFICILTSTGISMLYPLLSKQVMDNGLLVKDFSIVVKVSLITLAIALLEQTIGLLETKYYSYVNSIFQYSLTKMAFKHLQKLKIQYFNNTNFSETMSNIGMDVGNISRICDKGTFIILSQVFRIIGGMIGLLIIDWKLTFIVLLVVPVRYFTVKKFAKKRESMFNDFMEYSRDYASWFGDIISGIKEVKLWGLDRIKTGEFIKKQRNIVKINIKIAFMDKFNECSESIVFQGINCVLSIFGAYMVFKNELTIGGLFAFLTYSVYVIGPISAILNIGYNFSNVVPSAKRFFDFLDMKTEVDDSKKKILRLDENEVEGNIKFENVSFSYNDDEKILNNINLKINSGEKVAIIGANGSGKSTLINLLLRFYKPHEGKILIDGIDIDDIRLRDYRGLISVVSQDLYLFNTTIEKNISIGTKSDEATITKAAVKSGAYDFIKEMPLKYKSEVGRNGSNLSGGQRQKIAMARAFARKSKILILDEATANYDMESEAYVNQLLATDFKDSTVLVISHKPDILSKVDKIWMVEYGNIKEYRNLSDLEHNCRELKVSGLKE